MTSVKDILNEISRPAIKVLTEALKLDFGHYPGGEVTLEEIQELFPAEHEQAVTDAVKELESNRLVEGVDDGYRATERGYRVADAVQEELTADPFHDIVLPAREDGSAELGRAGGKMERMQKYAEHVGGRVHRGKDRCNFCDGHHNDHGIKRGGTFMCQECFSAGIDPW